MQVYSQCDTEGSEIEFRVLALNPADSRFTLVVQIQTLDTDDAAVRDAVIDSLTIL